MSHVCFFFFSSRRRHTRFDCDWSSDVCSSDLAARRAVARTLSRSLSETEPRSDSACTRCSSAAARSDSACAAARPARLAPSVARFWAWVWSALRSEEHTSELQSQSNLVCRLLLEKKKKKNAARDHH